MYLNVVMAGQEYDYREQAVPGEGADDSFEALLSAVGRRRDKAAFVRLFEYFAPRIKSFLMKSGAEDSVADELAQETMLSVWHKAGSYDPARAKASTWIYTIARNKRIDALRKSKAVEVDYQDPFYVADDDLSQYDRMRSQQEQQVLEAVIADLPEEQADLLKKSFYEGKSHNDIARETGLPLGTVKSRIRLALERLRGEKGVQALWH